jgi:hypothetical protein
MVTKKKKKKKKKKKNATKNIKKKKKKKKKTKKYSMAGFSLRMCRLFSHKKKVLFHRTSKHIEYNFSEIIKTYFKIIYSWYSLTSFLQYKPVLTW